MNRCCYDPDLDEEIVNVLKNATNKQTNFNKLLKELGKSSRTLTKHLNVLDKTHIINWNRVPTGRKGSIELSDDLKSIINCLNPLSDIDYHDIGVRSVCRSWTDSHIDANSRKRDLKLLLFLLWVAAFGYTLERFVNKGNEKPGDIEFQNLSGGDNIFMSPIHEDGFAMSDLYMPDLQSQSISFYRFLKDSFSKEDIEKMLATINSNDFFPLILTEGGRYVLKDNVLKEILIASCSILILLITYVEDCWYIISRKPAKQEIAWFRLVVGDKRAINFFSSMEVNRAQKKSMMDSCIRSKYRSKYRYPEKFNNIEKDKIINNILKRKTADKFTQDWIEKDIFENYYPSIRDCFEKISTLRSLLNKNYNPFFRSLKNIINPDFSKKYYNVYLDDNG